VFALSDQMHCELWF